MKCCLIGSDHNHCFHLISSPQLKFCIIIASKISFGQCRTSPQPPSSQTLGCPNANVSPPECIIWKLLHNKTSLDWVQSQSLHCWSAHPYSDVGSRRTSHHPTLSLGSQATEIEKEIWNIVWANINSILQQSALPLILQSFCCELNIRLNGKNCALLTKKSHWRDFIVIGPSELEIFFFSEPSRVVHCTSSCYVKCWNTKSILMCAFGLWGAVDV